MWKRGVGEEFGSLRWVLLVCVCVGFFVEACLRRISRLERWCGVWLVGDVWKVGTCFGGVVWIGCEKELWEFCCVGFFVEGGLWWV